MSLVALVLSLSWFAAARAVVGRPISKIEAFTPYQTHFSVFSMKK